MSDDLGNSVGIVNTPEELSRLQAVLRPCGAACWKSFLVQANVVPSVPCSNVTTHHAAPVELALWLDLAKLG